MTTGFGIPIDSKTASQTVGPRGPMLMVRREGEGGGGGGGGTLPVRLLGQGDPC